MFYITGNTHADLQRFNNSITRKLKKEDILIVCGDFGFIWDGSDKEQKNLTKLSKKKYTIAFVDGTHENFDLLKKYPIEEFYGGKIHRISPNIVHLMRGEIFVINNRTFFTCGGGETVSMDKDIRVKSGSWWKEELPDKKCIDYANKNLNKVSRKVDYIITHEPPNKVNAILKGTLTNVNPFYVFLDELSENVFYRKWFFGSPHIDRKVTAKTYSVFDSIIALEPQPQKKRWFFRKF